MAISEGRFRQILGEETRRVLREQDEDWQKKMRNPHNTTVEPAKGYPEGWTWGITSTAYYKPSEYDLQASLPGSNISYFNGASAVPHWVKDKDGWWYYKGTPEFFNKTLAPGFGVYHSTTKDTSGKVEWRNPDGSRKPDIEGPGPYLIDQNGKLLYIKKGNKWGLDGPTLAKRLADGAESWTVKDLRGPPSKGAFGTDYGRRATPAEFLRNAGDFMSDAHNSASKKK